MDVDAEQRQPLRQSRKLGTRVAGNIKADSVHYQLSLLYYYTARKLNRGLYLLSTHDAA